MTSASAPTISLAAKRPTVPAKPKPTVTSEKAKPTRTPYRPAPDTKFGQALRAAQTEAALAQSLATPSAAQIGALPGTGQPGVVPDPTTMSLLAPGGLPPGAVPPGVVPPGTGAPGAVDMRLWESLMRGAPLATLPARPIPAAPANAGPQPNAGPQANAGPARPAAAQGQPVTAMAARGEPVAPTAQAITPAAAREQAQVFLRSIKGFDQTSVDEYESVAQARAWGFSTCSAASLTAVLRAAGQDVRIADVMKEMPGGITIKLGLVSRPSLVNAANQFGAKAADDVTGYEALKQATEDGQPVLVDIRNGRFPEGHWIVVTGVDENGVRCADSSRYDLTSIPRADFLRSWSGKGIRVEGLTPAAAPARTNVRSA